MKITLKHDSKLHRGERAIMVDGVRWGQTLVKSRGMHGLKYMFRQEGGEVLLKNPNAKYPIEVCVYSAKKRKWDVGPVRSTEELVMETVRELVETARLRHPDVVKHEQQNALTAYQLRIAEAERVETESLVARAKDIVAQMQRGACGEHLTNEIVAAMRWAQTR